MDARSPNGSHQIDTVIIGGGQAGLSVGYNLMRRGIPFVILDASERVGDAWRTRWDSLRLFTPARYDRLDGMRFPASGGTFVTKDQMADYLETYANHFELPISHGTKVDGLSRRGDQFVVTAGPLAYEAANVVIAMANYQRPKIPVFADDLDPKIRQIHSHDYKNPSQLQEGPALVVGVGNSGAEIALDVAPKHKTYIAGKESGHVPFHIETFVARNILLRIVRFVGQHVLSVSSPIGRKARPKMLHRASPLIRTKPKDLVDAGIERVPRVVGGRDGLPVVEGGRALDVANIIWGTGYHPGFSWIDLPIFGEDGQPMHRSGIADSQPGLYFVGLHFLHSMTSDTITGMRRDARRIAKAVASRPRERADSVVSALD